MISVTKGAITVSWVEQDGMILWKENQFMGDGWFAHIKIHVNGIAITARAANKGQWRALYRHDLQEALAELLRKE